MDRAIKLAPVLSAGPMAESSTKKKHKTRLLETGKPKYRYNTNKQETLNLCTVKAYTNLMLYQYGYC